MSEKKTYCGILFAGSAFSFYVLDKTSEDIDGNDIKNCIENSVGKLSADLPDIFKDSKLDKEEFSKSKDAWITNIENKVYICVQDKMKSRLLDICSEYDMLFSKSYDTCIMNGLNEIIQKAISRK